MKKGERKLIKKTDEVLWTLVESSIKAKDYLILPHAKKRQEDRDISDIDVLDILENKVNRARRRNRDKDRYIENKNYVDWNYCIEGLDLDGGEIRLIVSFNTKEQLLVITVIRLD